MLKIIQKMWDVHRNESKIHQVMAWWPDLGQGQPRGQGAYTLCAIPGIDFPVLRPVERRRPYAGTRGQGGHGGRDGLIWLGKGRPRGCRVFLLQITQGRTAWHMVPPRTLRAVAIWLRVLARGRVRENRPHAVQGWPTQPPLTRCLCRFSGLSGDHTDH